jgi:hypothetical protein
MRVWASVVDASILVAAGVASGAVGRDATRPQILVGLPSAE